MLFHSVLPTAAYQYIVYENVPSSPMQYAQTEHILGSV